MAIAIRRYRDRDRAATARLWLASWQSTGLPVARLASEAGNYQRIGRELADGWVAYLAWDGDRLVGFLALKPNTGCLDQLFVPPEAKGSGIGRALLDFAKDRLPNGSSRTSATTLRTFVRVTMARSPYRWSVIRNRAGAKKFRPRRRTHVLSLCAVRCPSRESFPSALTAEGPAHDCPVRVRRRGELGLLPLPALRGERGGVRARPSRAISDASPRPGSASRFPPPPSPSPGQRFWDPTLLLGIAGLDPVIHHLESQSSFPTGDYTIFCSLHYAFFY